MSFRVCYIISEIDNFANDPKNQGGHNSIGYFKYYCPDNNCDTDVKKVISTFIALVTLFNGINHNEKLESDKIAEYAILWLSYKLNQKTQNGNTKLYDFYTEHINTNSKYNEHITNDFNINKSVIENKIKLMNMNIKDISKFYDAFKKLCEMYTEFDDDNKNCTNCSGKAKEFVEKYKDLNKDYNNTNNSSYNKMLSIYFFLYYSYFAFLQIILILILCDIIKAIDNFSNNPEIQGGRNSIGYSKYYCPDNNCDTDVKKVISTFIFLVTLLNGADNYENLEIDKMVEYAILWLSYKLNQKIQNGTTKLHDFYTKHIKTNSKYNEHITNDFKINQSVIENKIKSMNMNIKDISNFYDPFKSLCNMYIEVDASNRCMTCLKNAGAFFEKCEKLKNTLDITKGSSYSQLWYSLSNDYDKFKDKYNSVKCSDIPSLVA
ncbi:Plasmodium variant antigen protein Cir/Yir/Bir, putative, partial [Plasmodium berghei]